MYARKNVNKTYLYYLFKFKQLGNHTKKNPYRQEKTTKILRKSVYGTFSSFLYVDKVEELKSLKIAINGREQNSCHIQQIFEYTKKNCNLERL